jgi:hypothetical protein
MTILINRTLSCLFIIFSLMIISGLTNTGKAEAAKLYISLEVGQQSIEASKTDSQDTAATLEGDLSVMPSLALSSEVRHFGESSWGYLLELGLGFFDIDDQELDGKQVNLGTGLRGQYLLLTPTLVYVIESKALAENLIGLGVGAGVLNVEGDMVMTELPGQPREDFSGSGIGYSVGIFWRLTTEGDWTFEVKNYAPVVVIDGYELMLHNVILKVGHSFDIAL